MGGEIEENRGNSPATGGGIRGDGGGREGGRRDCRRFLPEEDSASGESQRGPAHVRVSDLLHQDRVHEDRQRGGQHTAGHSTLRAVHIERALRIRESRGHYHIDTEQRGAHLRQWQGGEGANSTEDWIACHSWQEPRIQIQSSGARYDTIAEFTRSL